MRIKKAGMLMMGLSVAAIVCIGLVWPLRGMAQTERIPPDKQRSSMEVPDLSASASALTVKGREEPGSGRALSTSSPETLYRIITDMVGRRVRIPIHVSKVMGTSPPPTTFVYMLAPEKLGGWMAPPSKDAAKFIPGKFRGIPVFGWGRGSINYEAYIAARPDLVFVGGETELDLSRIEMVQEKMGAIPVVCVGKTRDAIDYGKTIEFIGDVLAVPDRARVLNTYYQGVLNEVRTKVKAIPEEKRVRVYYAEGNNGLSTDPSGSPHSQLIDVCGGINVAVCKLASGRGRTAVTMESVLMWKPQVIITTSREFAAQVYDNATWKKLPAVFNHQVYLAPSRPFNWFDRPPGVNRIVGIPWTAHILYPERFSKEWFTMKAKAFYSIYYHYHLSDEELHALLNP